MLQSHYYFCSFLLWLFWWLGMSAVSVPPSEKFNTCYSINCNFGFWCISIECFELYFVFYITYQRGLIEETSRGQTNVLVIICYCRIPQTVSCGFNMLTAIYIQFYVLFMDLILFSPYSKLIGYLNLWSSICSFNLLCVGIWSYPYAFDCIHTHSHLEFGTIHVISMVSINKDDFVTLFYDQKSC